MKRLIPLICALSLSTFCFATETSSFKTATGQTIKIGDSLNDLISKIAQSPDSLKTIELKEGDQEVTAVSYDYSIGQTVYTVTVVKEKILKIERNEKS